MLVWDLGNIWESGIEKHYIFEALEAALQAWEKVAEQCPAQSHDDPHVPWRIASIQSRGSKIPCWVQGNCVAHHFETPPNVRAFNLGSFHVRKQSWPKLPSAASHNSIRIASFCWQAAEGIRLAKVAESLAWILQAANFSKFRCEASSGTCFDHLWPGSVQSNLQC